MPTLAPEYTPESSGVPSFLALELDRQSVKYAAGRRMFCPTCRSVLDCSRTVEIEIWRLNPSPDQAVLPGLRADNVGNQLHETAVMCAACFDKIAADLPTIVGGFTDARGVPYAYRVVDGRKLWATRAARKPAAKRARASKGV